MGKVEWLKSGLSEEVLDALHNDNRIYLVALADDEVGETWMIDAGGVEYPQLKIEKVLPHGPTASFRVFQRMLRTCSTEKSTEQLRGLAAKVLPVVFGIFEVKHRGYVSHE